LDLYAFLIFDIKILKNISNQCGRNKIIKIKKFLSF